MKIPKRNLVSSVNLIFKPFVSNNATVFPAVNEVQENEHVPVVTVTPPTVVPKLPSIEHNYSHKERVGLNKKQKPDTTNRQLFPPQSEHDHTYYTGAFTEYDIFNYPDVVKNYFENIANTCSADKENQFFNESEISFLVPLP